MHRCRNRSLSGGQSRSSKKGLAFWFLGRLLLQCDGAHSLHGHGRRRPEVPMPIPTLELFNLPILFPDAPMSQATEIYYLYINQ